MEWFTFGPLIAYNPGVGLAPPGSSGQIYAVNDPSRTTPLDAFDLIGTLLSSLVSNNIGILPQFRVAGRDEVVWVSGPYEVVLSSFRGVADVADAARTAAEEAVSDVAAIRDELREAPQILPTGGTADVDILWKGDGDRVGKWAPPPVGTGGGGGGATDWTSVQNKPQTFPPDPHSHTAGQITDATPVGRDVMKAASAQAARQAIGAGTGNGNSNLQVGEGGAAAYNHSHDAATIGFVPVGSITALNVRDAIVQASQSGGGSSTAATYVWRYISGAWPAIPASRPAGVLIVEAYGPSYPTSVPSWIGTAADKVPMGYSKVPLS